MASTEAARPTRASSPAPRKSVTKKDGVLAQENRSPQKAAEPKQAKAPAKATTNTEVRKARAPLSKKVKALFAVLALAISVVLVAAVMWAKPGLVSDLAERAMALPRSAVIGAAAATASVALAGASTIVLKRRRATQAAKAK
uniref:Uncharacterized protein n=1 Tax=Strombidinopsis acuminata TaxID=141414 RepID=A0A7S3T2E9_9SPIT